jgi:flagellar biosynthesis protein FlhB
MAEAADRDQKTEAPTQKRRNDAARDGDILQSRELGTALVMICGAAWLTLAGPWFAQSCLELLKDGLTLSRSEAMDFDPMTSTIRLLGKMMLPLGCLFMLSMFGAVAGPFVLGSAGFRSSAIALKANRINPFTGFSRIFGTQGLIELGKALTKATVLGALGYWLVYRDLPLIAGLGSGDLKTSVAALGASLIHSVLYLSLALLLIAGVDVPIQFFRRNARLRMTKQEVKEEMRQSEGSPELKQAIRQKRHALLSGSARKALEEANVILTNPTHFAVALRYIPGKDFAPIVVARGRGETAQAIKALAKESGVPLLEYPKLARAIYFTARAGQPVSEDLYIAVATILAFVFNIERALADGISQPEISVPIEKSFDESGQRVSR